MTTRRGRFAILIGVLALVGVSTAQLPRRANAAVDPAVEAQLVIYEINRARRSPSAFALESGMTLSEEIRPQPPVAPNQALSASADLKANEMAYFRYFGHQSEATGKWPNRLAREAGYPLPPWWEDNANNIESLNSGSIEPFLVVQSFAGSPSHRRHIFGEGAFALYGEIGVGRSNSSNLWAVHTAMRDEPVLFVTGVVFVDDDLDGRLDLGEGLPGVTVDVDGTTRVETNPGGGYSIAVTDGPHTITAYGPGLDGIVSTQFEVAGHNVGVDFISGRQPIVFPYALCNGIEPTILGNDGPDVIVGTGALDVINSFGGDDVVVGLEADDVLCGGSELKSVDGGSDQPHRGSGGSGAGHPPLEG